MRLCIRGMRSFIGGSSTPFRSETRLHAKTSEAAPANTCEPTSPTPTASTRDCEPATNAPSKATKPERKLTVALGFAGSGTRQEFRSRRGILENRDGLRYPPANLQRSLCRRPLRGRYSEFTEHADPLPSDVKAQKATTDSSTPPRKLSLAASTGASVHVGFVNAVRGWWRTTLLSLYIADLHPPGFDPWNCRNQQWSE